MADIQIQPKDFSTEMSRHWENNLGNVPSSSLTHLWETMCKAFNGSITSHQQKWTVLQPPTGTGKTQGLCVFSAMTAKANRDGSTKNGILVVTRTIAQAEEIVETINQLADFPCAASKTSENKLPADVARMFDVLVITHTAYTLALEGLCQENDSRWNDIIHWQHGKRSLTIIDEALANVIDEYQVKAEDIRQVLSYVTPELRLEHPSCVEALETVKAVLENVAQVSKAAEAFSDSSEVSQAKIVWEGRVRNFV